MNYIRTSLLFLFSLSTFYVCAQEAFLKVDKLEHIYTVKGDLLVKYDKQGKELYTFSHKTSGNISSIDVSDPLKILIFYRDLGQILFLDNTLSLTHGPVSLHSYGISEPILVCASTDEGIWIFDRLNMTLFKMDFNLQLIHNTPNLNQIIGHEIRPVEMLKAGKSLYINVPETGILVFDAFGTYNRTIHIKNIDVFNIIGSKIFYFDNTLARIFDMQSFTEHTINLPDIPFSTIAFGNNFICLWDQSMSAFHIKPLKN